MSHKAEEYRPRPVGWRCPACKQWVREPIGRSCTRCRLLAAHADAAVAHTVHHDARTLELR